MTTFWRDWRQQLIDEHVAAGHVLPGPGNCLDETHLDEWFWTVMDRAADEHREHFAGEFAAEVRETADAYRAWQGRQYVDAVMRSVEHRRHLRLRMARVRLRMEMHARGIEPLSDRERLALRRLDLRRRVAEMGIG